MVGVRVGFLLGARLGDLEGERLGARVGLLLGVIMPVCGIAVGVVAEVDEKGTLVGAADGKVVGVAVDDTSGEILGTEEEIKVGDTEG